MKKSTNCECCIFYVYDEEYEYYVCESNLDEDEMMHFMRGTNDACPHFRLEDDYKIVRKQM